MESVAFAKEIIYRLRKNNQYDITPLKLQKLLFLVFEDYAKKFQRAIFEGEFEVWRHGPVNVEVYNYFKPYKSNVITEDISINHQLDENQLTCIDEILKSFGNYSAWKLVDYTHGPKTIWTYKVEHREDKITLGDILDFYEITK